MRKEYIITVTVTSGFGDVKHEFTFPTCDKYSAMGRLAGNLARFVELEGDETILEREAEADREREGR